MADDTTNNNENADAAEAERAADATERQSDSMSTLVDAIKKANLESKKGTAELQAQLDLLKQAASQEESVYVAKVRNQKAAELRLGILQNELEVLQDLVDKGAKLSDEDQKRYAQLSKNLSKMKSAHQANNELINRGGKSFEDKVGGAVMRVADMLQRDLNSQLSAMGGLIDGAASKGLGMLKGQFVSLVKELDSLTANFERQTQLGPAYVDSINSQYRAMNQYGVSLEQAFGAQRALVSSVTDYTLMGQAQRDSISEATLLLEQQGIATEDTARGIQGSLKFFGQSAEGAIVVQQELAQTAEALGRVPGELAAEFAAAGPQLAKFGDQGVQAFKDLSRISKITGMDLDKILSMTNRFDTFEGAAEQAGKLNAAMGGNMVNAMDMMMETDPAARFETLRDSIMNTVGSFDDMSYYQKQFYTEALGLGDVSDLALMMAGDMEMLDGAQNQSAESMIQQRKEAQRVQSAQEKMQLVMAELVEDYLEPARDAFVGIATALQDNIGKIKVAIVVFGAYKLVMGAIAAIQAIQLIRAGGQVGLQQTQIAQQTVQNGLLAQQTALLTTLTAATTGKTVADTAAIPATASMTATVGTSSTVLGAAAGPYAAFGIAALKVGAAVLIAGAGIAIMALAFSQLSWEQALAMSAALLSFGAAAYFASPALLSLAVGLVAAGTSALAAAPGLTVLAVFLLKASASVFIVAAGIALMAGGMSLMFQAIDLEKAVAFGILVGTLALTAPFLLGAGLGFVGIGAGMLLFAAALKMISTADLEAMALFSTGMAEMNVSNVNALVTALKNVATAMDDIPTAKAIALTATMDAAAVAAKAAGAMVGQQAGARAASANTSSASNSKQPVNINLKLEIDGDALKAKIINTTTSEQSSGGVLDVVANILH